GEQGVAEFLGGAWGEEHQVFGVSGPAEFGEQRQHGGCGDDAGVHVAPVVVHGDFVGSRPLGGGTQGDRAGVGRGGVAFCATLLAFEGAPERAADRVNGDGRNGCRGSGHRRTTRTMISSSVSSGMLSLLRRLATAAAGSSPGDTRMVVSALV